MKQVALLFGSFNPIHLGHLLILNYVAQFESVDEVGLVLTPQNPLKNSQDLASNQHRLALCTAALAKVDLPITLYDLELYMPQPSYTIDTLRKLHEVYPDCKFTLLMGADNIASIKQWKDYQSILTYPIMVYPRLGYNHTELCAPYSNVRSINAPIIEISSSFIREALSKNKNVSCYVPQSVWEYIKTHQLYHHTK